MQVVLYDDSSWAKHFDMDLSNLKSNKFTMSTDTNAIVSRFMEKWENKRDKEFLSKSLCESRRYFEVLNSYQDSHFIAEMLGLNSTKFKYYSIISLENSLDFLLSLLIESNLDELQYTMNDYDMISKSLLTLDTYNLDFSFERFLYNDNKLDSYIESELIPLKDQTLNTFMYNIHKISTRVISYSGFKLLKLIGSSNASIRSMGRCRLLIGSNSPITECLDVKYGELRPYRLNINSFECGEIPNEFFRYGEWL